MRLCWHHLAWHWVDGQRYLRVWVDGKTGGRWLIARQAAMAVLERCHQRQQDIQHLNFEELFTQRVRHRVFRFSTGYQPRSLIGAFRRLLIDGGLLEDHDGRRRRLYSLRHTYLRHASFCSHRTTSLEQIKVQRIAVLNQLSFWGVPRGWGLSSGDFMKQAVILV